MFDPVQAEELAFAMSLFVSAANGRISVGRQPVAVRNRQAGRSLFLRLCSAAERVRETETEAALDTPLFQAFLIVWEHYRGDAAQKSISARVLNFYYVLLKSRGARLERWVQPTTESGTMIELHPAVINVLAAVELEEDGSLDEERFVRSLETLEPGYAREPEVPAVAPTPWPTYGGEMAKRVREHDWSTTALGPVDRWPQSLRTAVDLALACRFPMVVLWGPKLVQIYNGGYCDLMGEKHPVGLGEPTRECWPEVWHINAPIYARVLGGETVTFEDSLYPVRRHGGELEEAYFTLCYSPLRNEAEGIEGVLVTVFETTERVLAEGGRPG